jgi:Thioesterase-like superfamily
VTGCFYRRLRDDGEYHVFDSTDHTRSNWDPEIQHGSPPLALLTKAIEERAHTHQRIGRLSLDILGAIPVVPVRVRTWVERPGSRISLLGAEMLAARPDGSLRPVARVTAWLLATSDTRDVTSDRYPPLVEGDAVALPPAFDTWVGGYIESVSWRPQQTDPGTPAVYWLAPLVNVVDDEQPTPLQRLASVVDSANGVGPVLDPNEFVFMNTDTAVHLHRLPTGVDFALRARASVGPDGIGVTTAELFDRTGFIGTSAQTTLIQRRKR